MTGLLGVGGWLASSALSSGEANASELPPDPGSYSGTVQPDAGSVDLNQLSNSVLDQIAQLRANGHDFSVDVVKQASDSDQIPTALRSQSDSDSKSRKAWKKAAQRVADTPSTRVLPRATTPVTPTASAADTDPQPVTPTGHTHGRSRSDAPSQSLPTTPDRRDDNQNAPAASGPPIAAIPVGDIPVTPDTDADGAEPSPTDSSTAGDDNDPTGTASEPHTEIPDGAKERARLGGNNKDSLEPGEIRDAGVESTLFSRESDISNAVEEVRKDLTPRATPVRTPVTNERPMADILSQVRGSVPADTETYAVTGQPAALPGTTSESDPWISIPATTAVVWQQWNQRVFNPVKARMEIMQTVRAKKAVSGKSPEGMDPDPYLKPDSAEGEVPVSELPSTPPLRPVAPKNQEMPDPEADLRNAVLSEEQQLRNLVERDATGRTGYERSAGSIGGKRGALPSPPDAEEDADPDPEPTTAEQVREGLARRDATFTDREAQAAQENARVRPKVGDFGNGKPNAEPAPAPTTSQAQEDADAAAEAASENQELADLDEEGETIKENGEQTQLAAQKNIAASQELTNAAQAREVQVQNNENATVAQGQAAARTAATEAANGNAAEDEAAKAAAFQNGQQDAEARALSRPAESTDDPEDLPGAGDGEDVVPETDSGDSETPGDPDAAEGDGASNGAGPNETYDGQTPSTEQQITEEISGNGGSSGGEGGEGGASGPDLIDG
jgi:hypothetical protein